jgi:hypothetical protein
MIPDPWADPAENPKPPEPVENSKPLDPVENLERSFNKKSAERPPTVQQQKLNNLHKYEAKGSGVTRADKGVYHSTSRSVHRQSKARAVRKKALAADQVHRAKLKSAASQFKASSAQNISKFGGGVVKQFAPAIKELKTIAASQGVKARSLSSLVGNSKFMAGANSVPVLALTVGAVTVWKHNLKLLAGIYGVRNPFARYNPFRKSVIITEGLPPFIGGQSPGVRYLVNVTSKLYYKHNGAFIQDHNSGNIDMYGAIEDLHLEEKPHESNPALTGTYLVGKARHEDGSVRLVNKIIGNHGIRVQLISISVTRMDGQPDTGGNLPSTTPAETSQGGTTINEITTVNNITNVNNVYNNAPPSVPSAPIVNNYYYASSSTPPVIEPAPVIVPAVEPLPGDNVEKLPQSPTDTPTVKTEDTTKPTIEEKPSEASKLIKKRYAVSYDQHQQQRLEKIHGNPAIDSDVEKERRIEQNLKIKSIDIFGNPVYFESTVNNGQTPFVTRTVTPTARTVTTAPTIEKDTKTNSSLPIFVPGLYKTPTVSTTVDIPPTPPKPPIAVDPCKKGCGGNTPTPANNNGLGESLLSAAELLLLKKIDATTVSTNEAVLHKDFGLSKIQKFADQAWKSTQAEKALAVVNTALNIHNGMMLSNALGSTLNLIANQSLEAAGVKDHLGNPLNVGGLIRRKLNAMVSAAFGANNAAALTAKLRAYNRIYQTGANVLYSVRSIMDSTYDIAETTGENVSVIGNALRKGGVVRENAYKLMPENFRSTSRVQRRLEKLGQGADVIEQISGDALNLTEEIKEMKANTTEFNLELDKATTDQTKTEDINKKDATNTPEPKAEDEIRGVDPKLDKKL